LLNACNEVVGSGTEGESTVRSSHPGQDRAHDPTLTGHAGLLLTGELIRRLQVVETIDDAVNRVRPFKERQRGLNAGQLMVSLAETVMVGGDHLAHLDQLRGDLAGTELRAVPAAPAPPTAGQLLKRQRVRQCRAVVAAVAELGNHFDREQGCRRARR